MRAGGHDDREVALLVLGVGLVGLGDRIEGEVVGVLDPGRAGDLDAQRQAGRVVLLLAELEDPLDRLGGDGEDHQIGGRGGVGHDIRLTSGVVTDTPSTEPNEGHGPEVLYEVADHVATITLNRPASPQRHLGPDAASCSASSSPGPTTTATCACVILTGAGKGFCSGLDIKDAMAGTGHRRHRRRRRGRVVHADPQPPHRDPPGDGHPGDRGAQRRRGGLRPRPRPRRRPPPDGQLGHAAARLRQARRRPRVGRHVVPPAAARLGQGRRDLLPRSRHRRGRGRAHRAREPRRARRRADGAGRTSGPPRSPATRRWPSGP